MKLGKPQKSCSQNLANLAIVVIFCLRENAHKKCNIFQTHRVYTMQGTRHEIVVDKAEFVYPQYVRMHMHVPTIKIVC